MIVVEQKREFIAALATRDLLMQKDRSREKCPLRICSPTTRSTDLIGAGAQPMASGQRTSDNG